MCMLCCAERIQAAFVFECGKSKDGPCGVLGGAASRSAIMKATSEAILDAKQQRCQYQIKWTKCMATSGSKTSAGLLQLLRCTGSSSLTHFNCEQGVHWHENISSAGI